MSAPEKDILLDSGKGFLQELDAIAQEDAAGLKKAFQEYGPSWKQRGGVGAFMMLARNWDRINRKLEPAPTEDPVGLSRLGYTPWDIFAAYAADPAPEGMADHVRDLRRYLMLVEAEMRARGHYKGAGRHARSAEKAPASDLLQVQGVVTARPARAAEPRGYQRALGEPRGYQRALDELPGDGAGGGYAVP